MPTQAELCNLISNNSNKIEVLRGLENRLTNLRDSFSVNTNKSSVEGYDLVWSGSSHFKQFLPVYDFGNGSMANYDNILIAISDKIEEALSNVNTKITGLSNDNVAYNRTLKNTDWGMF